MAEFKNGAIGSLGTSRIATGRKNFLTYEIQGTKGSVQYSLESMNEVHIYFSGDKSRDSGFRKIFLNTEHEGYSVFQPQAGIAIGFNDMKILEVNELLSSVTKGTEVKCDFNFGWKIDRTIAAIIKSTEENKWIDLEEVALNSIY